MEQPFAVLVHWRQNLKFSGYAAAIVLIITVLVFWRFPFSVKVAACGVLSGLVAVFITLLQVHTRWAISFSITIFGLVAMQFATHRLAPPEQHTATLALFGSSLLTVWLGLVFIFRASLSRRLESTFYTDHSDGIAMQAPHESRR